MIEFRCHHCNSIDPELYMGISPCCNYGIQQVWEYPKAKSQQYVFNVAGKIRRPFADWE